MKEKGSTLKTTYNGLRIIWILLYLVYMFFFGFSSYETINGLLVDRTTYLVNLFDTLYNQNAIQMVSNPENFKRVLVSDIEGEVLLQYGELIPALTNLEYNSLFRQLQTEKIALSDFYYDPVIDETCFDMGIIEKNRVYIGTLSIEQFLKDNLETLELDHFLIFDSHFNGFIYHNNTITPLSYFDRDKIKWINQALFLSNKTLFLSHTQRLNNFRYITYTPFIKEVIPLFIYSVIPFCLGLLFIFLTESKEKRESRKINNQIEKSLSNMIKNNKVPDSLLEDAGELKSDLFRKLNEKFIHYESYKKDMRRYVEKLSSYTEQLLEMKSDMEYLEKYFYNLMNQEEIDFSQAIQTLFRIAFEKNETFCSLMLQINGQTVFSKENEALSNKLPSDNDRLYSLELGRYTIEYKVDFCPNKGSEFFGLRKTSFEIFSRYTALIYSVKQGLNPEELSLTKNFSTFSEMVNREIEKVKRYNEKGMLFYLDTLNYTLIKDKYGVSVAKIILKRISEIIISNIRNSDIAGIYREGTFMIYFCNLEEKDAEVKIQDIGNTIYNDEKIKQIGINIKLRSSICSVEKQTRNFDDLLLKCLQDDQK